MPRPVSSSMFRRLVVVLLVMTSRPAPASVADDATSEASARAEEVFANRVLPVFREKCFACHGDDPDEVRGEFNMLTREGLLKGGESEEASLVPGKPGESPLLQAVKWEGLEMPPKENDRLSAEQIGWLEEWIAGGAPWPDQERLAELLRTTSEKWNAADGVRVATSGGLSDDWTNRRYKPENLWAYQPLPKSEFGIGTSEGRNPIDVLIDAQLSELGLEAAPAADRRTLLRRATFDLIGLPPTPEEVAAFVNDPTDDDVAFGKVIDRLLASPHYGEQWGRQWLDVARYADSSGFANDYERGNAWRYRDYVVRSFNADKPYDEFIREQIAGDEIDPSSPELLIAVGFLRMGPSELTGMEVAKIARQRFLDDVTDAVGQVFLGHLLQCARCHDHKFDPIPTRDYYSMQAAFATTQLAEREAAFLPAENTDGFDEKKYLQQRQRFYEATLDEVNSRRTVEAALAWLRENKLDSAPFEKVVADLQQKQPGQPVDVMRVRQIMQQQKADPALIPPRHVGFEPRDFGLERIGRKGIERLQWRFDRYKPIALSVYDGRTPQLRSVYAPLRLPKDRMTNGELEPTAILSGGDPFSPQARVSPGVLSVVAMRNAEFELRNQDAAELQQQQQTGDAPIQGRRLALANWIASPDNPLTARVMVNRIWQGHFGQAIAGNPNNFGATGKKPTHPKLLDELARRLINGGWSIKSLHRLLMTSDAYRRSGTHPDPAALAAKDPLGTGYAVFRPRRLTAEELRDAMLTISGELNSTLGGIPARPEMNREAALQPRMVMGTFAEAWQPSPLPEQRHRRSLYALRIRGQRDPFLEVFNSPPSELSCEAREASTVTPQVFAMFNSEITFDRSLALANRVLQEQRSPEDSIARVFQLAYGRAPATEEADACLTHWDAMTARHKSLTFAPPEYPGEVVREAVEENTGEKFSFAEPLEVYRDFVPDLKPSDVSPEVRGFAEVCLVILNSNEFAYVY
jgi:mono/diheme cytochrome c family protein